LLEENAWMYYKKVEGKNWIIWVDFQEIFLRTELMVTEKKKISSASDKIIYNDYWQKFLVDCKKDFLKLLREIIHYNFIMAEE